MHGTELPACSSAWDAEPNVGPAEKRSTSAQALQLCSDLVVVLGEAREERAEKEREKKESLKSGVGTVDSDDRLDTDVDTGESCSFDPETGRKKEGQPFPCFKLT